MFAHKLKAARENLGFTQAEMAAFLDRSLRCYEGWERDENKPDALIQDGIWSRVNREKNKRLHDEIDRIQS